MTGIREKQTEVVFVLGSVLVVGLCVVGYKLDLLELILDFCQENRVWGPLLLGCIVFFSTFIPFPGIYTIGITSSGFLLGFPSGYFVAAFGTLSGSLSAFLSGRKLLQEWVERYVQSSQKFNAFYKAVEHGGFKVVLLFRLSPLPYGLVNLMMSATSVQLFPFALATAIDACRLALDVYVGSQSRGLHDVLVGNHESSPANNLALLVGGSCAIISTLLISIFVRTALRTAPKSLPDDEDPDPDSESPRSSHSASPSSGSENLPLVDLKSPSMRLSGKSPW